ncbi:transporter substrate-binding domain-containing protein [Arcanobacterium canis]|uniref:Transporter substrate-binding domain-containing protein n=1 Tax=Arcanobacterium canis TaxID=999183 RepID=A0ABY8G1A5_9ACTO|nr:transporter substrate-binding domain-containing protein [Arcanobacterium canis]WFM84020.1 transporter substrate-binding domain-containing protein [Arcanobacterium canis]
MRIHKILGTVALALTMAACSTGTTQLPTDAGAPPSRTAGTGSGIDDGVFTVAMEAAYAPYNWAQPTDANGAVPIKGSNLFANGYDVMTAKHIAQANGWKLEIVQLDWDSLIPAVQSGTVDAVIAGQSMTAEREREVDFAGPYQVANMVVLTKKNSPFATAQGISDLAGAKATSQSGTVWYDSLIPQIANVQRLPAAESAPAMLVALETGQIDIVPCDKPTAQGALRAYPDLKILDFTGTKDNFTVSDEDVNIGISVRKGNTVLKDAINGALKGQTQQDFDTRMNQATQIAPLENHG